MSLYRGYFVPGDVDPAGLTSCESAFSACKRKCPGTHLRKGRLRCLRRCRRKFDRCTVGEKINAFEARFDPCILKASGIDELAKKLRAALPGIDVHIHTGSHSSSAGTYSPINDELDIYGDVPLETYIHEMIHALDDASGWYLSDWNPYQNSFSRSAENLTYGFEAYARRAESLAVSVKRIKEIKTKANCDLVVKDIREQLNRLDNGGYTIWWGAGSDAKATKSDMADVLNKLSLRSSCKDFEHCFKGPCCEFKCN